MTTNAAAAPSHCWVTDPALVDPVAVAAVIAAAWLDTPLGRWLAPMPRARLGVVTDYARIWVDHARDHGDIDTITTHRPDPTHESASDPAAGSAGGSADGRMVAAAVWLPHDPNAPVPPPHQYDMRLARACRTYAERFHEHDATVDALRPHSVRHQHLLFLAVHPAHRDRGYATSLLTVAHHRHDLDRVPSVHITSTTAATRLARHHHYRHELTPALLPHDGPALRTLRRDPRPPA